MRESTLLACQDERGHQTFRTPLPIETAAHGFHAACDGQLGHVMRVYREWRISGDTEWMRRLWPQVKQSLDYAIETWDPEREGWLIEPHHNTFDIEFWGADGMCTSFYLAALRAAAAMAEALGEAEDARGYLELYGAGRERLAGLWSAPAEHPAALELHRGVGLVRDVEGEAHPIAEARLRGIHAQLGGDRAEQHRVLLQEQAPLPAERRLEIGAH